MRLAELSNIISVAQQKKLSGGITCNHLKIQDNGSRMLTVSGDVTVTLKVFDLTTKRCQSVAPFNEFDKISHFWKTKPW